MARLQSTNARSESRPKIVMGSRSLDIKNSEQVSCSLVVTDSNQESSMRAMVIIPTYNESENIEELVLKILALGENFRVTVVDDNSLDGTGEIAERLASVYSRVHVIHRPKKLGLGTAYLTGFKY